jgi:ArpU family phage transcriptional regulator
MAKRNKRPTYIKEVERILYRYPAFVAAVEIGLFPTLTANYGEGGGGASGISNPTEKYGVMRADKQLRVKQIDRALEAITYKECELIRLKYFDPSQPTDLQVYTDLEIGSTHYYKLKEQALQKIATALNII